MRRRRAVPVAAILAAALALSAGAMSLAGLALHRATAVGTEVRR